MPQPSPTNNAQLGRHALVPRSSKHPVRVADADRLKTHDLTVTAKDALDAAEGGAAELLRQWETDRAQAVARIAAGEAVSVAARPSEADAADRIETARLALEAAETNEAKAVAVFDEAVRSNLADLLPGIVATAQLEAAAALAAVEAANAPLHRALAARDLALSLRATEAFGYLVADGVEATTRYIADEHANTHTAFPGTNWAKPAPYSLPEQATDAALAAYALAPAIAETAKHVQAVKDALIADGRENAADPWPEEIDDAVARGLGRSIAPPPPPAPLETREEWRARYEWATAFGLPVPTLPLHLGGMVVG